jgi:hypothetical protein
MNEINLFLFLEVMTQDALEARVKVKLVFKFFDSIIHNMLVIQALENQLASREARITALEQLNAKPVASEDGEVKSGAIKIVTTRCDGGQLLQHADSADERWVTVDKALVVYVSFAKGADMKTLPKVARTLLHLPLLTTGNAGWSQHKVASKEQQPRSVIHLLDEQQGQKAPSSSESNVSHNLINVSHKCTFIHTAKVCLNNADTFDRSSRF